jgi:hypothetical protein
VALPFGRWVWIDRLPDEPMIAFVYLDQHAGPSAKGGLAGEQNLATMPSRTVRLAGVTVRELSDEEVRVRKLPERPAWLDSYGPQPDADAPWRNDPLLAGQFHPQFPDDTQALVHDGDPRRMRRGPELCWVRFQRVARAPTRRLLTLERAGTEIEPSRHVYVGELLNQPHTLKSVKRGDRIKVISVHGLPHPLHVTDDYLTEREGWAISPCDRCGATEVFDPPSVMAKVRFPDAPAGAAIESFTSFCSMCGGMQMLRHLP